MACKNKCWYQSAAKWIGKTKNWYQVAAKCICKNKDQFQVADSWIITRNAVIVLYVLLECLKWISTLISLAIVAYP